MTPTTCPRCGQPLPEGTYLEELQSAEGRLPAYRLRHPKPPLPDGKKARWCVAYVGVESATMPQAGAAPATPAS